MGYKYKIGETFEILIEGKNYNYYFHPQHRNNTPKKSQWTCSLEHEITLFKKGVKYNWKKGDETLYSIINYESSIGKSNDNRELFFSKFVSKNRKEWHGYPADYVKNVQDRPSKEILNSWLKKKLIKKIHIRKTLKGQPW